MRAALVIAARDLRGRLRDRSALVTAFAAPIGLAVILSTALGSADDVSVTLAFADADGGQVGQAVAQALAGAAEDGVVTVVEAADAEAVRAAVDAEEAGAGLVVPAGASGAISAGQPATVQLMRTAGGLSGDIAEAVVRGVAAQFERVRQVVEVGVRSGAVTPADAGELVPLALDADPAVRVVDEPVRGSLPNAASYFGPAMAVFFVFFVVGAGPQSLLRQRKEGTLARLAAAPIPRASILVGTALSVFALALVSIATLWLVMSLGFGATWGHPAGVVVLAVAITLAAAAITTLVATLARTEEQVTGWTSVIVFTLALLGGSFGTLPPALEPLSLATPNGLALRGLVDLAAGGGLDVVLVPLAGVAAFTVVALAVALPRADRLVAP
ncbi:MAG TPA: ABC transporter permease [Egibacteraceae bacterium]|nr:ABC transporter permease [Egibacteraceae bacterium]